MAERIVCLDTSVIAKALVVEEPRAESEFATELLRSALADARLIAPSWAWAETASVLRKKQRLGMLSPEEAASLWSGYLALPIDFLDSLEMRKRAWEIADQYALSTLYDAAFLACTELAQAEQASIREYWTADAQLLRQLGTDWPVHIRALGDRI
jgi:predicted nucleic acid-binding protein